MIETADSTTAEGRMEWGRQAEALLNAALSYARCGWPVFPLHTPTPQRCSCRKPDCDKPGKHPWITGWPQRATTDECQIHRWWSQWPDANIGVPTGEKSGLTVLDIDNREGIDGFASLAELEGQHGALPNTPTSITGGGGEHRLFKNCFAHNRTAIGPGLDIKGEGGYIIVPPSLHPSGKRYAWKDQATPEDIDPPEMPEWLHIQATQHQAVSNGHPKSKAGANHKGWHEPLLQGVEEGRRNDTAARLAGRYLRRGLTAQKTLEFLRIWNQRNHPPLGDQELERVVESIERTHARNHLPAEDPLRFPEEIISGVAGEYADLYGSHLEPPRIFFYFAFLTCLGSVLANRLTLASEISPQPRLYVLLLGESADDRKSTAIHKTIEFFQDALGEEFRLCHGVGSAEGLQKKIKAAKGGKLLLVFDEFKAFVSKCSIDASVLLPCVTTLFEENVYETNVKREAISLRDAHLSILGASTTATHERMWSPQFIDIGFTNRIFLVPGSGRRRFAIPRGIPKGEKQQMADRVKEIIHLVGGRFEMRVQPDALKIFEEWYLGLERSVHAKRLDTYALRLLPLVAINDGKAEVDVEVVEKVIKIMDWQLRVRQQLDPIEADNKIAAMEEKIRRTLSRGPMKKRDLKRHTNANRSGLWAFEKALENLSKGADPEIERKGRVWKLSSDLSSWGDDT